MTSTFAGSFTDSLAADRQRTLIADATAARLARSARTHRGARPTAPPSRRWTWTRSAPAHS